jgi:hypothetical protein
VLANATQSEIDDDNNSWSLSRISVTDADFVSLSDAQATSPRAADGSLPSLSFLRLTPGSDLIDKGEGVGFPYFGAAPDLGAFEFETAALRLHRLEIDAALADLLVGPLTLGGVKEIKKGPFGNHLGAARVLVPSSADRSPHHARF